LNGILVVYTDVHMYVSN